MLTACRPSALQGRLAATDLPGQLALARDPSLLPRNWPRRPIGDLWLAHHEQLPLLELPCCDPQRQLLFLGPLIDPQRRRLNALDWVSPRQGFFPALERLLHGLGGRFLCIARSGGRQRLYLDASGSLSLLYSRRLGMAASSLALFPPGGPDDDESDLIEALDLGQGDGYFAFGCSPRRSIRRLLPNHLLNLDSWRARRHWPLAPIPPAADVQGALAEIATLLQATLETVIEAGHRPYLSLTAGYDTRVFLALLRRHAEAVDWFTWELPDAVAEQDVDVARQLAAALGLRHSVIPFQAAGPAQQAGWLLRSGLAVGELRGRSLASTVAAMGRHRYYLPAIGNEAGRGAYWRDGDHPASDLSAANLLRRLRLSLEPRLLAAARGWLGELAIEDSLQRLDLLYIEQRLGCWAGVTAYGDADGPIRILPCSNRRLFELMLSLPAEMRREDAIPHALISRFWPQLLAFPVNGLPVPPALC